MKKNFRETIHQRPDDELSRIAKDYAFYSTEERFLAMNELKKRKRLPDDLVESKKMIGGERKHGSANVASMLFLFVFAICTSIFCIIHIREGLQRHNVQLRDTVRREGVVELVYEFTQYTPVLPGRFGVGSIPNRLLSIRFFDMPERFSVWRMGADYSDLRQKIGVGDTLTVYSWQGIGHEVVRIEKNGEIILDINEFHTRGGIRLYFGFLGLLGCVLMFVWIFRLSREGKPRSRKRRAD